MPSSSFFQVPGLKWWVCCVGGMALMYAIGFGHVQASPPGPLRLFLETVETVGLTIFQSHAMLRLGFWIAVGAHIFEMLWALYLCSVLQLDIITTVKWGLQTVLLGFPSLTILIKTADEEHKD
jgi:hypothetical protein